LDRDRVSWPLPANRLGQDQGYYREGRMDCFESREKYSRQIEAVVNGGLKNANEGSLRKAGFDWP